MEFSDFLADIDQKIPKLARHLSLGMGGGTLSIRKHYKFSSVIESSEILAYLADSVTHVHGTMAAIWQEPEQFYRGYDAGWGGILQNLDAKRTVTDSILVDAILDEGRNKKECQLYMLKGPAGNGKSITLKRVAFEAATNYDQLVFYAKNPSGIQIDPLTEISRLTGKRIFLFVDRIALARNEINSLISSARERSLLLTVIGAERDNEWNIYCENLERFLTQEFQIDYLNSDEILDLVRLLDRHKALGILKDKSEKERIDAFHNAAERQLLVALHEATLGIPFEDIVFDEYKRIEPSAARRLYLQIAALHQFGTQIRAGLISRVSGVGFAEFDREFLKPLENVVLVIIDSHTGDAYYRTRHQHVASIVFNRAVENQDQRYDLLVDLIDAMNIDYSSDRETFSRVVKGRTIAEIFPNVELGRLFFDKAESLLSDNSFVFHQRAVFEMAHVGGALKLAEDAAKHAASLNPKNHSIQHTLAEISRRLANETSDPLKKQVLRKSARERVSGFQSDLTEYDHYTKVKLGIDELRELLVSSSDLPDKDKIIVEAVKSVETSILKAAQFFPDSSQISSAEAQFRELINDGHRALTALEKAFKANPRQDWLASRLAKKYRESGDAENAIRVLRKCLDENPSSKTAHLELARTLIESHAENDQIIEHLRRSFTTADDNFEAQFWYARALFIGGRMNDSAKIFVDLHKRASGRFRNGPAAHILNRNGVAERFNGQISRIESGYAFLNLISFAPGIFASRSDSVGKDWLLLKSGSNIVASVAFNRRGVRGVDVHLR